MSIGHSYWLATLAEVRPVVRAYRRLQRFRKAPAATKDEVFAAAQDLGIGQRRDEIAWVAGLIEERRPKTMVEIGTQQGGNAFYLASFMPPGSRLVTVDLHPRLIHQISIHNSRLTEVRKRREGKSIRKPWRPFSSGCSLPRAALVRRYSTPDCEVVPYFSYFNPFEDADFIVNELLGAGPLDAIFYDGDKVKEGVELSLRAYLPFLRPGGLLMLQDIRYDAASGNSGMRLFWDSLPRDGLEKLGETPIIPGHAHDGIGVARRT